MKVAATLLVFFNCCAWTFAVPTVRFLGGPIGAGGLSTSAIIIERSPVGS